MRRRGVCFTIEHGVRGRLIHTTGSQRSGRRLGLLRQINVLRRKPGQHSRVARDVVALHGTAPSRRMGLQ